MSTLEGLPPYVAIGGILLVTVVLLLLINQLILRRVANVVASKRFEFGGILVSALKFPLTLLALLLVIVELNLLLTFYELNNESLQLTTPVVAKIFIILAIIVFVDRFSAGSLAYYSHQSDLLKNSGSITKGITRLLVYGLGTLVLFSTLGISITPIIASLGIGSLAVALALQPTLENFFSGVQLVMDKPIRVGDFIELDSGEQGFVEKIGWRSTWIKMLPNNMIVMPNSVLSQSKIVNYFYPEKELSVPVDVGVHYSSDLEFVERVTIEVAQHILKTHKWGVPEYETFVVYHTFDSSSINFTVMLRTREYFNRFFIKSAFIKALHKRYAEEGIVIPYPIRAINVDQEGAKFKLPVDSDQ